MPFMWADTLLAAERAHLFRLIAWGAGSLLLGTALLALLRVRRRRSDLLDHFGVQIAAWGAFELLLGAWALRTLALRDLASATRLDRLLWLRLGLDAGLVLLGLTLGMVAWRPTRRLGLAGGAIGVLVQGAALALLDLLLAAQISR